MIYLVIRQAGLGQDRGAHLCRLAQVFSVNYDQLELEVGKLFPVAAKLRTDRGLSNLTAWQAAVSSTERARVSYSLFALGPVLVRYAAWTISTSGVEQTFAIHRWVVSPWKRSALPQTEQDRLTIACHKIRDPSELQTICEGAQATWRELYGHLCSMLSHLLDWWCVDRPSQPRGRPGVIAGTLLQILRLTFFV